MKPLDIANFVLFFKPKEVTKVDMDMKIHVVNNPFEITTVSRIFIKIQNKSVLVFLVLETRRSVFRHSFKTYFNIDKANIP